MSKNIGLIGSITHDVITHESGERFEGIGGVLYQAAVLCGLGKTVFLFSQLAQELKSEVDGVIGTWGSLDRRGLKTVPGAGNRVHLHYPNQGERVEILKSVVPPLSSEQITPHLFSLGMLVMILNSGFDINLEEWRAVVDAVECPIWLDVHSMTLSKSLKTPRKYISFSEWREWAQGLTYIQANKVEVASMLGSPHRIPGEYEMKTFGRMAFESGAQAVFITLGEEGVLVLTPGGSEKISPADRETVVDTTGCGDVFCAGAVASLVEGKDPYEAASIAVGLASQAVSVYGVPATFQMAQRKKLA